MQTARSARGRLVAGLALSLLALAPSGAEARPNRSQFELSRTAPDDPSGRMGVFVDFTWMRQDFEATYEVDGTVSDYFGDANYDATYQANGVGVTAMLPRFGLTYALSDRLLLDASVGVSFMSVEERLIDQAGYQNDHRAISSRLRPGIALEAGGLWTWKRFGDFALTLGGRLGYRSASKEAGDDVSVRFSDPTGASSTATWVRTDALGLRTLSILGSAGLEWRPRNTWFVNDFGIVAGLAYTFGKIDHTVVVTDTTDPANDSTLRTTVDIGMFPSNFLGLYYGWSIFVPRVGVFGIEAQFLAEPRVTATYEYIF